MNISTLISVVAAVISVGCATKSPPLVVAFGRFVSQRDEIELRMARYEVLGFQRGRLPTHYVEVVFWKKTQIGELPQAAVLLLSRPIAGPLWHAVGEDASRGILPDTPDNRSRIASLADARILDGAKEERLPRSKAEQIVRDYLRAEGFDLTRMDLKLRRAEFGWRGSVVFPDERGEYIIGREVYLGIRDCGDILYWSRGL